MIENDRKTLENVSKMPTKGRCWETTAMAIHENEEQLMIQSKLSTQSDRANEVPSHMPSCGAV
jgi:hypothetical protein